MKLILTVVVTVLLKFSWGQPEEKPSNSLQNERFTYRVFNGNPISLRDFPFLARIRIFRNRQTFVCTGSLLSHYYIVTAAHCVSDRVEKITVNLGSENLKDLGAGITCSQCWKTHPEYVYPTYPLPYIQKIFDIALIQLPDYVRFTDRVSPVQLPSPEDVSKDLTGEVGTVIGWGKTNVFVNTSNTYKLALAPLAANTIVLDQPLCRYIFSVSNQPYDYINQFCTTHAQIGSCEGDSGGPFIIQGKIFGVVSGGTDLNPSTKKQINMCGRNYADNFGNVAKSLEWIKKNSDVDVV